MNPPYLKVAKDSMHAQALADIVHGQPNMYALFMAQAARLLRPGGAFVSITPRSFANGPYFRAFRKWFLSEITVDRFHLFGSRREPFAESKVLQESLITAGRREPGAMTSIYVSHSPRRGLDLDTTEMMLPADTVIDNHAGNFVIRLPESDRDLEVLKEVESWPHRFNSIGLRVSTGQVVAFRAKQFIQPGRRLNNAVPLLGIQNVRAFQTIWPHPRPNKTHTIRVVPETEGLILPAQNYVLLRRFSAKEEARRLTASILERSLFPSSKVALENHLNYIYHADRELTEHETAGICALLNSSLLDTYFRTISGNTQVNAAEIRTMPFPSLAQLEALGHLVHSLPLQDAPKREQSLHDFLKIRFELNQDTPNGSMHGKP
jgi:adenine-specific DNA-methyltransferase